MAEVMNTIKVDDVYIHTVAQLNGNIDVIASISQRPTTWLSDLEYKIDVRAALENSLEPY